MIVFTLPFRILTFVYIDLFGIVKMIYNLSNLHCKFSNENKTKQTRIKDEKNDFISLLSVIVYVVKNTNGNCILRSILIKTRNQNFLCKNSIFIIKFHFLFLFAFLQKIEDKGVNN